MSYGEGLGWYVKKEWLYLRHNFQDRNNFWKHLKSYKIQQGLEIRGLSVRVPDRYLHGFELGPNNSRYADCTRTFADFQYKFVYLENLEDSTRILLYVMLFLPNSRKVSLGSKRVVKRGTIALC